MCITSALLLSCGAKEPESFMVYEGVPSDGWKEAAVSWLNAGLNQDGTTFIKYTCSSMRDEVQNMGLGSQALLSLAQLFIGPQNIKGDITDLQIDTVSADGRIAYVHAHGEIRTAVGLSAKAEKIDQYWKMIYEDDTWRWCGEGDQQQATSKTSEPNYSLVFAGGESIYALDLDTFRATRIMLELSGSYPSVSQDFLQISSFNADPNVAKEIEFYKWGSLAKAVYTLEVPGNTNEVAIYPSVIVAWSKPEQDGAEAVFHYLDTGETASVHYPWQADYIVEPKIGPTKVGFSFEFEGDYQKPDTIRAVVINENGERKLIQSDFPTIPQRDLLSEVSVSWSSNHQSIAFSVPAYDETSTVYLYQGGNIEPLMKKETPGLVVLGWGDEHKVIVGDHETVTYGDGQQFSIITKIHAVDLTTRQVNTLVTSVRARDSSWEFDHKGVISPDEKKSLLRSEYGAHPVVSNLETGETVEWPELDGASVPDLRWVPDNKHILFGLANDNKFYLLDIETGEATDLALVVSKFYQNTFLGGVLIDSDLMVPRN